jgi:hypothetical protein
MKHHPLNFRFALSFRNTLALVVISYVALLPVSIHAQTKVVANDVVINGESFFAASNIRDELNRLARRDSVIGPTESFRQVAVSGALIAQILGYYRNATPKPKYVISDGGGNDLMGSCPGNVATCPTVANTFATVKAYFDTMATNGTKKVLWMRYPDPQGTNWATLKTNQDLFNPLVKALCDTVTLPKCVWIDLRPVWEGKYAQYTSDGIHATNAGGTATAEAFWKVIVDSNFFDLTPTSLRAIRTGNQGELGGVESFKFRVMASGAGVHVQVSESGPHTVTLHDASGRILDRRVGTGAAEYKFSAANRSGLYFVRVKTNGGEALRKVLVGPRGN